MALSPGTRLGPYEVLSPLGAGGMGEVYRARDSRLKRDVAVKVLPEALSRSPDALARFEREAHAVAALSHPGILSVFDVGEEGAVRFVVTELLEGETLRALASRGPVPLKRALEVVHQLADALAAAHEKGIVHRDVKPDNVFVTTDGRATLLDFGLARVSLGLRDPDDSRSPTESALTEAGAVVGTVAYMSPEQASGRPADHRSDQFSLGVVLYELLAGRRPFARATAAETLAAIIRDEPEPLARAAAAVPAPVRWLAERLLHKEAGGRWDSTRDLARELGSLRSHLSETASAEAAVAAPAGSFAAARPGRMRVAAVVVTLSLAAAVVSTALTVRDRRRPGPVTGRFEIRLPDDRSLAPWERSLALSPDGRLLVFAGVDWKKRFAEAGASMLYARPLDSLDARPIAGTEGGAWPTFSPDGRQIAYVTDRPGKRTVKRVPASGGPVKTVCECDATFGISWAEGGSLVFASGRGPLKRVAADGAAPQPATTLDVAGGEVSHRLPHLLPDGRTVLYTALRWTTNPTTWTRARIYAARPGQEERTLLVEDGSDGRWAPPGVLLFARQGNLLAAPFDGSALKVRGPAALVLAGVHHAIWAEFSGWEKGAAHVASSDAGLLAWSPGSVLPEPRYPLLWVDPSGREAELAGGPIVGPIGAGRVSADGRRVLISYAYPGREAEVLDLDRGARRRVTFDSSPTWAIWGPGPDRVTFTSDREGPIAIYSRRLDAPPNEVETLWKPAAGSVEEVGLGSWSRDGELLAFVRESASTGNDIWLLESGKPARPFLATPVDEGQPDISPDGRWLLYTSTEAGHPEVFARALTGGGGSLQVSSGIGGHALWSRDGTSVTYWVTREGALWGAFRVAVTQSAGSLRFGVPERLFDGARYGGGWPGQGWDVAPDGRFLVNKVAEGEHTREQLDKLLSGRIVVDTGGVARLLADARAEP